MNHPNTGNVLLSRQFLLSFCSFFFLWISFDFFILFPLFILQKGGNSVDVGLQEAIFFLPSVFMRPFAGRLIDRIGRLKVLWFGSLTMIITALMFLLLRGNYHDMKWWIALNLFARGAGFAAFYTAFFTYVADLSIPENRARVIGLFGVSGLIAHGLAPRIGEIVLHSYNFSGFFLISGLLALMSLFISAFMKEERILSVSEEGGWKTLKKVALSNRNLIFLPGAFVFGYVVASFNTFGAAYFKEIGKGSVGNFFLVYGLTAGMIRIVFGGLADRFSRWKLIAIFFALQGVGLVFIIVQSPEYSYLVSAAVSGAAHGILFPTMSAMAIDAHPANVRGVVTSVFTGVLELGFSIGSYLQGVFVQFAGFHFMFLSASLSAFALSVYVVLFRDSERQEHLL